MPAHKAGGAEEEDPHVRHLLSDRFAQKTTSRFLAAFDDPLKASKRRIRQFPQNRCHVIGIQRIWVFARQPTSSCRWWADRIALMVLTCTRAGTVSPPKTPEPAAAALATTPAKEQGTINRKSSASSESPLPRSTANSVRSSLEEVRELFRRPLTCRQRLEEVLHWQRVKVFILFIVFLDFVAVLGKIMILASEVDLCEMQCDGGVVIAPTEDNFVLTSGTICISSSHRRLAVEASGSSSSSGSGSASASCGDFGHLSNCHAHCHGSGHTMVHNLHLMSLILLYILGAHVRRVGHTPSHLHARRPISPPRHTCMHVAHLSPTADPARSPPHPHHLHYPPSSLTRIRSLPQILLEIFAMRREFFRQRMHVIDLFIVAVALVLESINSEHSIFLVVLMSWRVVRVLHAILSSVEYHHTTTRASLDKQRTSLEHKFSRLHLPHMHMPHLPHMHMPHLPHMPHPHLPHLHMPHPHLPHRVSVPFRRSPRGSTPRSERTTSSQPMAVGPTPPTAAISQAAPFSSGESLYGAKVVSGHASPSLHGRKHKQRSRSHDLELTRPATPLGMCSPKKVASPAPGLHMLPLEC